MTEDAATKPVPKSGQVFRTPLPDSLDGIGYVIVRMAKFIREGAKAAIVREKAREFRHKLEARPGIRTLRNLHAWGVAHFVYADDPANVQVLETPMRMLRKLKVPASVSEELLEPFYSPITKSAASPPGKISGTTASSTMLVLALAGAAGFKQLRMRLGGHDGTLHYAWGQVRIGKRWIDVDLLNPELGKHPEFGCYEYLDPNKA